MDGGDSGQHSQFLDLNGLLGLKKSFLKIMGDLPDGD